MYIRPTLLPGATLPPWARLAEPVRTGEQQLKRGLLATLARFVQ
jgi:hypothetical protein